MAIQEILDVAEECYYSWLSMSKAKQAEVCKMIGVTRATFYEKFIRKIIAHAYGHDPVQQLALGF